VIAASSPSYHVIVGSRSVEKGEKALSELKAQNPKGTLSLVQLDVTDQTSIANAVATVEKEFGRLDVLINNAGIVTQKKTLIDQLRDAFETNTLGPAVVTDSFKPLLLKSKNARLIYVSSGLGSIAKRSNPNDPFAALKEYPYHMSKAALNMLMACDYAVLGPQGVKAWTYCPGYVVTNLTGTGEKGRQERIANGAGSPRDSANGLLAIIEGKRDADVGKFVHQDGLYEW
jgi:NAD(P)-dependent dehydrogenase (short-subunit alcohol dehydrogenase family)